MLELQNIQKRFFEKPVLTDVTLRVRQGDTHALIGSSGSGKTTLLRITLGVIPFDQGSVRIDGQDLASCSSVQWAERIGYIPQEAGLFPHLTAKNNVLMIAKLRKWSKQKMLRRLSELCALVDLDSTILKQYPHQLSGGQRQRVAIMRAAFMNPPLMLLDEPMGALDPLVRRSLQKELKSIFQRLAKTVVIVTHDLSEAVYFAEEMTLLHEGRVMQTGTYRDFCLKPSDPFVTQFINAHRTLPDIEAPSSPFNPSRNQ